MKMLMQAAFVARGVVFRLFRVRTRGVKVMLFNEAGELLLIRNSYGHSRAYVLPGGGIKRGEAPVVAAARELKEEVALNLVGPVLLGTYFSNAEGKRDTIYLFSGEGEGRPEPDGLEVAEARFFPVSALPKKVSAATRRRIAEYRGERERSANW